MKYLKIPGWTCETIIPSGGFGAPHGMLVTETFIDKTAVFLAPPNQLKKNV